MDSIFSETDLACTVCGSTACVHFPLLQVPHVSEKTQVAHVLAPVDVSTEPGPYGGAQLLYRKGDPVPLEVAVRLGWMEEPLRGPAASQPRRRVPASRAGSR